MKKIRFDVARYPFAEKIAEWFEAEDLSRLHEVRSYGRFTRETDQSTVWHEVYYAKIRQDPTFNALYLDFLVNVVVPAHDEPVLYQRIPNFRVHLPDNLGVGEFHRDRTYNHFPAEINQFLPLTRAWGTNTIWTESAEDKADYAPMELRYGELAIWDGANLMHGNKTNDTGSTRVSLDFRVLPVRAYRENDKPSVNGVMEMKIGGYWEVLGTSGRGADSRANATPTAKRSRSRGAPERTVG